MHARIGVPGGFGEGLLSEIESPEFATVAGLIKNLHGSALDKNDINTKQKKRLICFLIHRRKTIRHQLDQSSSVYSYLLLSVQVLFLFKELLYFIILLLLFIIYFYFYFFVLINKLLSIDKKHYYKFSEVQFSKLKNNIIYYSLLLFCNQTTINPIFP